MRGGLASARATTLPRARRGPNGTQVRRKIGHHGTHDEEQLGSERRSDQEQSGLKLDAWLAASEHKEACEKRFFLMRKRVKSARCVQEQMRGGDADLALHTPCVPALPCTRRIHYGHHGGSDASVVAPSGYLVLHLYIWCSVLSLCFLVCVTL